MPDIPRDHRVDHFAVGWIVAGSVISRTSSTSWLTKITEAPPRNTGFHQPEQLFSARVGQESGGSIQHQKPGSLEADFRASTARTIFSRASSTGDSRAT